MSPEQAALLLAGGLLAGVVNTLAGGGSLVSVPLLVLVGLPGTLANGTNRIGVLAQSAVAAWRFRAAGLASLRDSAPVLAPALAGALAGALGVARLPDAAFERLFGAVMLALLLPTLRPPRPRAAPPRPWPPALSAAVFFAIGLYGGALQAGVGLVLVAALSHAGFDLVRANGIKTFVTFGLTAVAAPVFVFEGQVAWGPALLLAAGFGAGGGLGARLAVRGGERLIRPVLGAALVALAGRMLRLW
jgi:hypothetical protein